MAVNKKGISGNINDLMNNSMRFHVSKEETEEIKHSEQANVAEESNSKVQPIVAEERRDLLEQERNNHKRELEEMKYQITDQKKTIDQAERTMRAAHDTILSLQDMLEEMQQENKELKALAAKHAEPKKISLNLSEHDTVTFHEQDGESFYRVESNGVKMNFSIENNQN